MKKIIALVLVAAAVFFCVRNCGSSTDIKPTKNLIVMITDGTCTGLLSLTRWFEQYQEPKDDLSSLAIDPYICGLVRTFCSDSPIAESAGSMSQYMTGVLQQGRNISVYPHANPPQDLVPIDMSKEFQPQSTLLEAAKIQKGKSVGVVATCYHHHATPAATSAHSVERGNEYAITRQMASQGLDVCFAGGAKYINDTVRQIFDEQGITYYEKDIEGWRNHKEGKVWALFSDKHMAYELDRKDNEPSLTEMTLKAIDLLSKNKKGFFLMVEGSKVDFGAHANDPIGTVTEFIEFNNAVQAVMDFAKKDGNTTVVIMPDHGTGGVQMGERNYRDYLKKGLDSMYINMKNYKASGPGLEELVRGCKSVDEITAIFKEYTGLDLTEGELNALLANRDKKAADHMSVDLAPNLGAEINKILTKHTHVGWVTGGHTGEDVFLAVYNPNDQRPMGLIKNIDLNRYMRKILGLKENLEDMTDRIFVPHYQVFKGYDYSIVATDKGPCLKVVSGDVTVEVPSNRSYVLVNGERKDLGSVVPYIKENKTFYLPAVVRNYLPKLAPVAHTDVPVYAWCSIKADDTPETFKTYLQGLKDKGVTGVCVNSSLRDRDRIAMAAKAAHEVGLVYHAWLPCMLQGGMPHSWYAVNAEGKSADTDPVYVDYYKALDPHNPEVIDWLVKQYTEIAQIPDVDYVQLDYIRYPDAVLSRGLWAKYNLDMSYYYAPADYCYCKDCQDDFKAKYGRGVKSNHAADKEWAQFRQDVVTSLVNKIVASVHAVGKKVSADVFPGPDSYAKWMVRQEWDKWDVDEYFPMNYNDFYLTDTKWVARITGEEVRAAGKKPVYSGLFICHDWQNKASLVDPENSGLVPSEVEPAVLGSMDNGAAGICLFTPDSMTEDHWAALDSARKAWLNSK